jgi:uncharacterized damage-inducible protein DinB
MDVFFIDLFEYDHSANRQWLEKLRELETIDERPWRLLSHIAATKKVWWHRLQEEDSDVEIWPELSPKECENLLFEMHRYYIDCIDETTDEQLESAITYQNSSGKTFNTPVREVLMHLLTHNHYHRGQIAQSVREQGYEPIWTDYIVYSRLRSGDAGSLPPTA